MGRIWGYFLYHVAGVNKLVNALVILISDEMNLTTNFNTMLISIWNTRVNLMSNEVSR